MDFNDNDPDYVYDDDDEYDDDTNDQVNVNVDEENADLFFGIDGGDEEDDSNEDDDTKCVVVKPDEKKNHRLGVVKSSFSALVNIRNKNLKKIFIETVQKFVLNNTEIAVRCGMIMHHVVMNCINTNNDNPPQFGKDKFVNAALNYSRSQHGTFWPWIVDCCQNSIQ